MRIVKWDYQLSFNLLQLIWHSFYVKMIYFSKLKKNKIHCIIFSTIHIMFLGMDSHVTSQLFSHCISSLTVQEFLVTWNRCLIMVSNIFSWFYIQQYKSNYATNINLELLNFDICYGGKLFLDIRFLKTWKTEKILGYSDTVKQLFFLRTLYEISLEFHSIRLSTYH